MAIEGPITKVINIITAAQESSPNYISQALDKVFQLLDGSSLSIYIYISGFNTITCITQVLDILRSTELFAPHVAEVKGRNEDPVTTDLVGALLLVSIFNICAILTQANKCLACCLKCF